MSRRKQEIRIPIDDDPKAKLEAKAEKKGMPLTTYCRSILLEHVENECIEEDLIKKYNEPKQ